MCLLSRPISRAGNDLSCNDSPRCFARYHSKPCIFSITTRSVVKNWWSCEVSGAFLSAKITFWVTEEKIFWLHVQSWRLTITNTSILGVVSSSYSFAFSITCLWRNYINVSEISSISISIDISFDELTKFVRYILKSHGNPGEGMVRMYPSKSTIIPGVINVEKWSIFLQRAWAVMQLLSLISCV